MEAVLDTLDELLYLYMYYGINKGKVSISDRIYFDYADFYQFASYFTTADEQDIVNRYGLQGMEETVKEVKKQLSEGEVTISENPHESIKQRISRAYARLTSVSLPVVITNLPFTYSVTEAVRKANRSGIMMKVRGLVLTIKPPYFFESAVKIVCSKSGISYKTVYGDFWNNIPASKLVTKEVLKEVPDDCDPVVRPIETKVLEFDVIDLPEDVEGGTPTYITTYALGKDVLLNAGDQIELIITVRGKQRGRVKELVFEYEHHTELKKEEEVEVDWEVVNRLKHMQFPHNFFSLLVSFGAPVYGWWTTKAFLLASAVLKPQLSQYSVNKVLDPLPVLMAGDPQVGKTTLANLVAEYVKPSVRVKATTVTPAGLTLSAEKTEGGRWVYKPGLLIMYRNGLIVIEELSRNPSLSDELLLPIETGEVTRSTAGGTVNIRTNAWLVFVTNPVNNKWSDTMSVKDNLAFLSDAFLSRVSVHVMRRPKYKSTARMISKVMFMPHSKLYRGLPFTPDEVKMIIRYLRTLPNPDVSTEALEVLMEYIEKVGEEVIGPRDEINILRLAKGIAKIDFSTEVLPEHMSLAIFLEEQRRMQNYGEYVDDIAKVGSEGSPTGIIARIEEEVYKIIEEYCSRNSGGITATELLNLIRDVNKPLYDMILELAIQARKREKEVLVDMLKKMANDGRIYITKYGGKYLYCTSPIAFG